MLMKQTTLAVLGFVLASPAAMAADMPEAGAAAQAVQEYSTIESLPEDGTVNIQGTVEEVDREDKSFTLKDQKGDTIGVQSAEPLSLSQGDTVKVLGKVQDTLAGMGEEIKAEKVIVISRR